MLKLLVFSLLMVLTLIFALKYMSVTKDRPLEKTADSLSIVEMGRNVEEVKQMSEKRQKDTKHIEKQLGVYE